MTKQMTSKIELITVSKAKALLDSTRKNRNLRQARVDHYARQIKKGKWEVNGEAICISVQGKLINGQHRCAAVIKAGMPIKTFVARNLPEKAITTIDLGAVRTVADHLHMQGIGVNPPLLAAAVNICLLFEVGKGKFTEKKMRFSPQEVIEYIDANKGILKSMDAFSYQDMRELLPLSVPCALHYLFGQIDRMAAAEFFHKLASGEKLGATSPILKLRSQLISMRNIGRKGRYNRKMFIYYVVTAFKAFYAGRQVDGTFKFSPEFTIELPKKKGGK